MPFVVRIAAIVMAVASTAAACSSGSDWTDREVQDAALIWVNQLGLNETDPDVWSGRLDRICEIGYAPGQAMEDMTELAGEFVADDADVNVRADGLLPPAEEAVESLWIIAQSPTCSTGETDPTTTTALPLPTEGVITIEDPTHQLVSAGWMNPTSPALTPMDSDMPSAVIMESSKPSNIHIAVRGNACRPRIELSIQEVDPFTIGVVISEGIPPNNIQCPDILTSHGFSIEVDPPVEPSAVQLTVTSIPHS